jgi:hypothetical protein
MGAAADKKDPMMRGRMNVRRTIIEMIPERIGNARSFLSCIRISQLVFTSAKLLPILSNIKPRWIRLPFEDFDE